MTCRDYLNLWNDRLDGHSGVDVAALELHAADCPACARLAIGFQAIESHEAQVTVPDGMTDRILAAWALERPSRRRPVFGTAMAWGVVGSLAAAAILLILLAPWRGPVERGSTGTGMRVATLRPWTSTLAEATSSTIHLARDTSAPAARLGQEVLIAAQKDELAWAVSLPAPAPPTSWLPSVTKSVSTGVRPISGSARRAFSFLSAPASTARPAASRGDSGA